MDRTFNMGREAPAEYNGWIHVSSVFSQTDPVMALGRVFQMFGSRQVPCFKFLSIPGHNFFIYPLQDHQNTGYCVPSRVPKMRFFVRSR